MKNLLIFILTIAIFSSCKKNTYESIEPDTSTSNTPSITNPDVISLAFGGNIDLENLFDYANQSKPAYITKDNTANNGITNEGATLGRVLFYDKNLSVNNMVACASCHKQEYAFGDIAIRSEGLNGETGRHSMRLVNARYADEAKFFWDERATSLEIQTTMPIQDHIEMGYSGTNGDPNIEDLITKLKAIDYFPTLFEFVYGDSNITEERMQNALAQFVRSIQSFDSKYDEGRNQVAVDQQDFPNFTAQENLGKALFFNPPEGAPGVPPGGGGAGCQGCHRAPEFDIDPNSRNNGIVLNLSDPTTIDPTNTRAPSLRDVFNQSGELNGPLMHSAEFSTMQEVIDHYNDITVVNGNNNLDPRLMPAGQPQQLNLTTAEKEALIAFLKTLSGENIYKDTKWSNPFI